jgi:phage-related protein
MANLYFNSHDLADHIVTPEVSGTLDLPGREIQSLYLPGQDIPVESVGRLVARPLSFHVVVAGTDHADLISKLGELEVLLHPDLGYKVLTVVDRPNQQTMARCRGWGLDFNQIPYLIRVVEFDLVFDRYPYWEDVTPVTANPVTNPMTVGGNLKCYPIWTCTVGATLAGGLSFTVNGETFEYEGALASSDVLTVDADPQAPTPKLNGTVDWANTATDAAFPGLIVGSNTITKSSTDFVLRADYRRRY